MMSNIVLLLFLLATAFGACPNGCSGNGICGNENKCSCHQDWEGPDCSLRTCAFSLAWADTADGTNQAHYYAECGNKGVCDRATGECQCFDGFEGKGCRRMACPDNCSGHGQCTLIEDISREWNARRYGPGSKYKQLSCYKQHSGRKGQGGLTGQDSCSTNPTVTSNVVSRSANTDVMHGYLYQLWDAGKTQVCKCDLAYDGPDCSRRMPPKGDDPLTTRKANMMKQAVQIQGSSGAKYHMEEFYMVYHDPYGGVWRTDGIDATNDDYIIATRVQDALRELPNEVLEGVNVRATVSTPTICHRWYDGLQYRSAHTDHHQGYGIDSRYYENNCKETFSDKFVPHADHMDFTIEFGDGVGQSGVQYLFEVDITKRGAGSFPISAGVTSSTVVSVAEVSYNAHMGNLSELADCSDRGLDDGEGSCECFDGFRGLACEEQDALV